MGEFNGDEVTVQQIVAGRYASAKQDGGWVML